MCTRSTLGATRKRTVDRYKTMIAENPMSWDDITTDLEIAQKETTRVGSQCYTTVADFGAYVEKNPHLKELFSKPTTPPPKKKCSRARDYYNRNPDKYQAHIEKMKTLVRTPEQKQYADETSLNQRRRVVTVNRYTEMLHARSMTLEDILKDLETVQSVVTKFNNPMYTTVEDFEKYIGNKIRILNTYDKEDASPTGKFVGMLTVN